MGETGVGGVVVAAAAMELTVGAGCSEQRAARLTRGLRGGRCTSCKSAKDRCVGCHGVGLLAMHVPRLRVLPYCVSCLTLHLLGVSIRTSMSVTLEQAFGLTRCIPLTDRDVDDISRCMRLVGVRRHNVAKNIGKARYAFNALQVRGAGDPHVLGCLCLCACSGC